MNEDRPSSIEILPVLASWSFILSMVKIKEWKLRIMSQGLKMIPKTKICQRV